MMKPIHILHYEDNASYRDSFKLKAQQQRIIVQAVDNAEELIELLEADSRKYQFVVLDAKAYLHEGQSAGSESETNLFKIFPEIQRLVNQQNRPIPYCINTGFSESKLSLGKVLSCPIYEKGNEDALIKYIWQVHNNSPIASLRLAYPAALQVAETHFDDGNWQVICSLLPPQRMGSNALDVRISNLANLRRLVEHLLDTVYHKYLNGYGPDVRAKGSRASNILTYIKELIPVHAFGNMRTILDTASNFGSHNPQNAEEMENFPSNYSIQGLTLGFVDTVICAGKMLPSN